MRKYLAVIDTNIIVSAMLKRNSTPAQIIAEALHGCIIPVLNDKILLEYEDVLMRPKFYFNSDIVNAFLQKIKERGIFYPEAKITEVLPDVKDTIFYAVLIEARKFNNAYLITGNLKHFPQHPYILSPRGMLELITKGYIT